LTCVFGSAGEPIKLVQLEVILDVIARDSLLEGTRAAGKALLLGLEAIARSHPAVFCNARGVGTFCAIDATGGAAMRDRAVSALRERGVLIAGCGVATIRLRPALVFTSHHAQLFLRILADVAAALEPHGQSRL
jgi:4-aminobutyrate aminotransferase/(S)-3-amino-2-methylpropionate transaminase